MHVVMFFCVAVAMLAAANEPTSNNNNCQQACEAFVQLTTRCSDVGGGVEVGGSSGSDISPLSKQLQCLCSLDDYYSLTSCLGCLRSSGQGDAFADEIMRLQAHCRSAASSREPPELHEL